MLWNKIKESAISLLTVLPIIKFGAGQSSHEPIFNCLVYLSDDLILEILSYICYGPYERDGGPQSPLTHVLPYVSRHIRFLCNSSDMLWMEALVRLLMSRPDHDYEKPLLTLLRAGNVCPPWSVYYTKSLDQDDYVLQAQVRSISSLSRCEVYTLLSHICQSIRRQRKNYQYHDRCSERKDSNRILCDEEHALLVNQRSTIHNGNSYSCIPRFIYMTIVQYCIRFFLPILFLDNYIEIMIGNVVHIHLAEKRYHTLVNYGATKHLAQGVTAIRTTGSSTHAHIARVAVLYKNKRTSGYVGEIVRLIVHTHGMIDISVKILQRVQICSIRERGLFEAELRKCDVTQCI